jgi:hypothetical protein
MMGISIACWYETLGMSEEVPGMDTTSPSRRIRSTSAVVLASRRGTFRRARPGKTGKNITRTESARSLETKGPLIAGRWNAGIVASAGLYVC